MYLLQSTVSQVQQHISPSAKSNSTFLFLAFPCPFLSYPFLRQLANYVYALKYCTNTVANVNILYMNFIRCDVLVACPHRKLNGVGSNQTSARVGREHHRTACRFARRVMLLNIEQILLRTLIYYTRTLFGVMCSLHARIGS